MEVTGTFVRRLVEAGLLAAAGALLLAQGGHALRLFDATGAWWLLAPVFLLGVLAADFATGTVHWLCDHFFSERTPLIGEPLIRPFREHHADPRDLVGHDLLELHSNSAIPVVAALGVVQLVGGDGGVGVAAAAFHGWLFFLGATGLATNQLHMWAHAPKAPRPVRWAQRHGLILSPERHALHHEGGYERSYCVTSGWMNPILDRTDLFGRIERGVRTLQARARR